MIFPRVSARDAENASLALHHNQDIVLIFHLLY
jgi:hypothetical protein